MNLLSAALLRRPEPDALEFVHEGRPLRVSLRRRPNARRMTLRVSNVTGEVILTLPPRTSVTAAKSFAVGFGGWIATRLAKVPQPISFDDDVLAPLRGRPHRIVNRPGRAATRVVIEGDEPLILVSCEKPHIGRRVRDFLAREARRDLTSAVTLYAERVGRKPRRMTIRDTRSRWGSCTAGGDLNFSWRLILAPEIVLDYLAAHEVTHLREMNHSSRFWTLLNAICPHVDEAEAWLKRHGSELHRYG